jgi:hypothetical protein
MAGLCHRIRALIPYSGDDVWMAGMKPTMALETEFCGKCVQWRRREFDKKSFAIAAPRVQLPQCRRLLSYGKATVCRRISSMHSRAYPKRTLDL